MSLYYLNGFKPMLQLEHVPRGGCTPSVAQNAGSALTEACAKFHPGNKQRIVFSYKFYNMYFRIKVLPTLLSSKLVNKRLKQYYFRPFYISQYFQEYFCILLHILQQKSDHYCHIFSNNH